MFLSNRLTSIRNGVSARSNYVVCQVAYGNSSSKAFAILSIMRKRGMIRGFSYQEGRIVNKIKAQYYIYLKYDATGISVIDTLFFVSKPSRRIYISAAAL